MKHVVLALISIFALVFVLAEPAAAQVTTSNALDRAAGAPVTPSLVAIEEHWGVRILGVRLSAAGNMMDFRYHVVDPGKAAPLFIRGLQPVLQDEVSGAKFIVPAPPKTGPLRSTNVPQAGRNYFMFFANPARFVRPGNAVTITIGEFRVEHLQVMAESEPFPETPRFDPKSVVVRHPPAPKPGATAPAEGLGSGTPVPMGRARPAAVTVPALTMTDQDGVPVNVKDLLEGDVPVILAFMFTSCTTNCPVMAATLSQVQRALGPEAAGVRFVSVSIDPEEDSPKRLREFLAKHDAHPGWRFLTGSLQQSETLQRAFDVYRGNKNAHPPGYFIRDAKSGGWSRIGGLPAADVVIGELRRLAGQGR